MMMRQAIFVPRDGTWNEDLAPTVSKELASGLSPACSSGRDGKEAETPADLSMLTHLNEPCILHALEHRYAQNEIYTAIVCVPPLIVILELGL